LGNVIAGTGMFAPDNVVTNHDLARIRDTSDDRITSRTGVRERRFGISCDFLDGLDYGAALYRWQGDR
jgi:3-oxoacyl-[acyl-carrier-protein] synthase III